MFQVGIFAKYWEPGRVKTRLAASIGEAEAANLYGEFLLTLLDRFRTSGDRRVLAYSPAERVKQFAEIADGVWQLEPQSAGDVGRRMTNYFAGAFNTGATRAALIGSDSPTLPQDVFDLAFQALDAADVVLGPSDDGGYYLVGASRPFPAMFEGIEWSSARVFQQTVDRLAQSDLTWSALPPCYDIDDLDDLQRLQNELSECAVKEEALIRLSSAVDGVLQKVNRNA